MNSLPASWNIWYLLSLQHRSVHGIRLSGKLGLSHVTYDAMRYKRDPTLGVLELGPLVTNCRDKAFPLVLAP